MTKLREQEVLTPSLSTRRVLRYAKESRGFLSAAGSNVCLSARLAGTGRIRGVDLRFFKRPFDNDLPLIFRLIRSLLNVCVSS